MLDFKRHKNVSIAQADWAGKVIPVDIAPWAGLLVRTAGAHRVGYPNSELFAWYDDSIFTFELRKLGKIIHVDTTVILHAYETGRWQERYYHRRLQAQDFWKQYYLVRNSYLLRRACFGRWYALREFVYGYARCLVSILILDDAKIYRMQIMTKAFVDALLGRMGRRVEPGDFEIKFGRSGDASSAGQSQAGSDLSPASGPPK
jgi:GT2 family glycosyltransferase